jgi:RNA polymerase sigma factor (sigma-70 family)
VREDRLDETALVERARNGDVAAFEHLVSRYQDLAVRTAWVVSGSAGEAEDAAQEAFVKAYLALGRFRAGAPFRPWLLQIVVNEARNRRKSAGRRANLALRAAAQHRADTEPSPEAATLAGERDRALLDAVNHLREEERLVVACRYFLGLTEAETAETLRCPRGTVKSRLSRALDRLRNELSITLGDRAQPLDGTNELEQTAHG